MHFSPLTARLCRDPSVKITYALVSEVSFACRHSVTIQWSKPQEPLEDPTSPGVEVSSSPTQLQIYMEAIATPDAKQSEAYIATFALFHVFGSSPKEERVFLRLPPVWREFWNELAEAKKSFADAKDREAVKELRDLIRKRQEREMEDGVLLQGAFKGRGGPRNVGETGEDSNQDRHKPVAISPEYYQKLWEDKSRSPRFQEMLVGGLPSWALITS